jgi:hypothetical protein
MGWYMKRKAARWVYVRVRNVYSEAALTFFLAAVFSLLSGGWLEGVHRGSKGKAGLG